MKVFGSVTMSGFADFRNQLDKRASELDEEELENELKLKELVTNLPNVLKFDTVTNIFTDLELVQSESKLFRNDVHKLKNLSQRLNNNVNKIKSVWNRVKECENQIDELINLKITSENIKDIIDKGDYETAAEQISRYLEINKTIPKPLIATILSDNRLHSLSKAMSVLAKATDQLKSLVQYQFNEVVETMNFPEIQRLCKVSFLIGMQDDGLRLLCEFLKRKLDESCQENLKFAHSLPKADLRYNLIFDEVLAMLFESIGILIEENYEFIETYFGNGKLLRIAEFLQNECDNQVNEVLKEFKKSRKIQSLMQSISDFTDQSGVAKVNKVDTKALDIIIDEMSLMHFRFELYFRFLHQKISEDFDRVEISDEEKITGKNDLDNLINSCNSKRCKSEILNNYLLFEKYYLEESISKAIDLDVIETGQKTSSVVEDVFFLVKKCLKRAISTNSLNAISEITNEIGKLFESNYCDLLQKRLKQGYSRSTFDTIHAYTIGKSVINLNNKQQFDELTNHIITLNNVEISIEFIDEVCCNLITRKNLQIPLRSDEEKILLTISQKFAKNKQKFEESLEFGLQQLQQYVIKPKIGGWMDSFLQINFKMSEEELINYEANESFIQTLMQNLDSLIVLLKKWFSIKNFEKLLNLLITELTTQLEILIRKSKFNRLGGLILDKELRQLTSYLTNVALWSVRDKFSRLLQIAAILNLESISEVCDYHDHMIYKFSLEELKQILKLRVDFSIEEIRKLQF